MDPRELKEMLGNRAKHIISQGLNRQLNKHDEMLCVFHSDNNPSLSWYEQGLTFNCLACGEKMDIFRYYTEFENMSFKEAKQKVAELVGVELSYKAEKKIYTKATESFQPITKNGLKWFESRGIKKEIVEYWGIESNLIAGKEYVVFKHYDSKGKLILNASRDIQTKDFLRETGNKTILFGIDKIDYKLPVIITEGHPDAMSVSMVYKNVVSVPAGITNVDWIENCWTFINKVDRFIFWADNDNKNGISEAEKIRLRIGKEKCSVEFHHKYKDANDLLKAEGIEGLQDFVEEITMEKVDGLINMGRRRMEGREIEKFKTGFGDIDRHLKSIEYGALSIIFGRDNEGKSTFISQMISEILKTQKVFLYSGELSEYKIEDWIMSQIVAGDEKYILKYKDEYGDDVTTIKGHAKEAIAKWYRDKFFLFEAKMEADTTSGLFKVMEQAFKIYGVRIFFIDNIMSAVDDGNGETTSIENAFIKKMKNFALTYNVHVFVVAHPNKIGSVEYQPLNKVDVNGSKGITNIADYIFAVERSWDPTKEGIPEIYRKPVENDKNKFYTGIVRILKNRSKQPRKDLFYRFQVASLRFYNDAVPKMFTGDWKKYLKPESKTVEFYNGEKQTFEDGEFDEMYFKK